MVVISEQGEVRTGCTCYAAPYFNHSVIDSVTQPCLLSTYPVLDNSVLRARATKRKKKEGEGERERKRERHFLPSSGSWFRRKTDVIMVWDVSKLHDSFGLPQSL